MKVVGFLQNAWSPYYAGRTWPRESWLRALERSRSGQRLKILTEGLGEANWWFDNTTPIVGNRPDSVVKPDLNHVFEVLDEQRPDYIVGFGKQAKATLLKIVLPVPAFFVPHPASRTLTNNLYYELITLLEKGTTNRWVELFQERDGISYDWAKEEIKYVC